MTWTVLTSPTSGKAPSAFDRMAAAQGKVYVLGELRPCSFPPALPLSQLVAMSSVVSRPHSPLLMRRGAPCIALTTRAWSCLC
eukprot:3188007-Rhodomonas_salina.3